MSMETGKITGESHYACREIVAERDALAARLAEAERLLREAESDPHGHLTLSWGERTRAFLGTPDSADGATT